MIICSQAAALLPVGAVFGTFIAEGSKGKKPAARADVPEWCSGRKQVRLQVMADLPRSFSVRPVNYRVCNPVVSPRTPTDL